MERKPERSGTNGGVGVMARRRKSRKARKVTLPRAQAAAPVVAGERDEPLATAREAEARHGGAVEAFNDAGAVRLCSRDGLAHLFRLGRIGAGELAAGMAYRAAYEVRARDLRSQLAGGVGGGSDHEQFVATRMVRAQSACQCHDIEAAVLAVGAPGLMGMSRGSPYQRGVGDLAVLRAVAGEGRAISSLGSGGSMAALNLAALKRALEVAAQVIARPRIKRLDRMTRNMAPKAIAQAASEGRRG